MPAIPSPVIKFVTLFGAPLYLILLAAIFARATECLMIVATAIVFLNAVIIMAIIAELSYRFLAPQNQRKLFSISSMMMVTVIFACYFSYIRQVVQSLNLENIGFNDGLRIFLVSSFFIVVTTLILIRFADALIELLKAIHRVFVSH